MNVHDGARLGIRAQDRVPARRQRGRRHLEHAARIARRQVHAPVAVTVAELVVPERRVTLQEHARPVQPLNTRVVVQ